MRGIDVSELEGQLPGVRVDDGSEHDPVEVRHGTPFGIGAPVVGIAFNDEFRVGYPRLEDERSRSHRVGGAVGIGVLAGSGQVAQLTGQATGKAGEGDAGVQFQCQIIDHLPAIEPSQGLAREGA